MSAYSLLPIYQISLVREGSVKFPFKRFSNSREIFQLGKQLLENCDREYFYVLSLDAKNQMIGLNLVSVGSLSTSVVHPREVFKLLVLQSAAAAIFFHNHPSGDPSPSREDKDCTIRLINAGTILGIRVLDHIIIGSNDYYSFADSGMLADTAAAEAAGMIGQ
jgi:DNA repair protein RadC